MGEHDMETAENQGALARWRQTQPLRLWLYGIAVPLLAALVGYGLLTGHHSALWLAVLQAILLGGGVEGARQYAVSPATARAAIRDAAAQSGTWPGIPDPDAARYVAIRYRIPS